MKKSQAFSPANLFPKNLLAGSHHHANCRECDDVIDIPNEYFSDLQQRRDSDHGFLAELEHISISGLCECW